MTEIPVTLSQTRAGLSKYVVAVRYWQSRLPALRRLADIQLGDGSAVAGRLLAQDYELEVAGVRRLEEANRLLQRRRSQRAFGRRLPPILANRS